MILILLCAFNRLENEYSACSISLFALCYTFLCYSCLEGRVLVLAFQATNLLVLLQINNPTTVQFDFDMKIV